MTVLPGTHAAKLYRTPEVVEPFLCNYGVNPDFQPALEDGGLVVSGLGTEGEVRIVELPDHPFFVATFFVPQIHSTYADPHPILKGYAAAVNTRRAGQRP
ncbi:MAG: hypothetical protein GEU73_11440 [Chloroflexi bacterium]|nr:hypothetical protein [Chloroflexota bacterium]